MSMNTNIQWCDSSVNPVMGCDGCELWMHKRQTCYAGILHRRYAHSNKGYARSFDKPEMFPGRMALAAKWKDLTGTDRPDKPWLNGLPRTIFISDMGDALSDDISFEFLHDEIIHNVTSEKGRRHVWLWLTKRPTRMRNFGKWISSKKLLWPGNLWAMTSITGHETAARSNVLRGVGCDHAHRGISFEPLWTEPDWDRVLFDELEWAIFGGESGHQAESFDVEILRRGIAACRSRGIPVFVKQLGTNPIGVTLESHDLHNANTQLWPEDLRLRQMPDMTPKEAA